MAEKLCASGPRRGDAIVTFARREALATRLVVWAPGAGGGTGPIGTVGIQWRATATGEAILAELTWPPTSQESDLWHAVEELAGTPIPR